jgi:hypothetical protein
MDRYDPLSAPDAAEWLETEEGDRIALVRHYHRRDRVKLPNALLHATMHVVVENQIAMGDQLSVACVVDRLQAEGLDRHEAVHAVGAVLTEHIHAVLTKGLRGIDPNRAFLDSLETLTAESWRRIGHAG